MTDNQKEMLENFVVETIEEFLFSFDQNQLQFCDDEEIAYIFEIMGEKFLRELRKLKSDYAVVNTKTVED